LISAGIVSISTVLAEAPPTVVLSAGAGDFAVDWALVQPEVAKTTRVCSYDRSGEAWSDLGPALEHWIKRFPTFIAC